MPKLVKEEPQPEPIERLAINLFDLDRIHGTALFQNLLGGRLDLRKEAIIRIEQDTAVPFLCGMLTAATACDILRAEDVKQGDVPMRVYLNRGKGWTRISTGTLLTRLTEGRCGLSPDLFPSTIKLQPLEAPKPTKVTLGRK